ncbi:GDSL-type esterase/lipase family protein [Sphingobacterium psychroaquaticum]|uniref:Lysophospholipase L1 n=1 Tax=Sphingobacterium psychroaquaticum TaxID=561061 RepID=A0A1X7KJ69_9SPHI|nr:GDSL-type esterase/lipase family protein [Sphingobacterium psychroaquaticum]SMG40726.1 Lysophospholipase L1 [Sphingobacterium psychroaquaticum]
MRKLLVLCALLSFIGTRAQDKLKLSADSGYHNWYYESREKLYQGLKDRSYDVVFFGNSITERGPWQELIGRKYKVGNRGIGGDNTFGMKARIADVAKLKPKKIFLMMGINDVGRGLPTAWSLKNYEEVIQTIQQISPRTKIYVQSTLPLNEKVLKYDYLFHKEAMVRALNDGVLKLAQRYKLTYVDVKEVLADDHVLKADYTMDGIHINTDGYLVWVKYLKDKKYL